MTAGEDALREAARQESARVYGRLCPETAPLQPIAEDRDAAITYWRRRGQSPASIAFRLGCTKRTVKETLHRLGAA